MGRKETWAEKLEKLAREHEVKLTNEEWIKERLRWEDWATLSPEAEAFAAGLLKRRGMLPGGYDAQSITAQVIADLLEGKGTVAPGWTRERLMKELHRLMREKVRLLRMLKETKVTRSEWETKANGKEASLLEEMAGGSEDGYEAAVADEGKQQRQELKERLERMLASDEEVLGVFRCRWQGLRNPAEIAQRLGLEERAVVRARKRLDRRLARLKDERDAVNEPAVK